MASIVIANAGSSSIKAALFRVDGGDRAVANVLIERIGSKDAQCRFIDSDGGKSPEPLPAENGVSHAAAGQWLLPRLRDLAGSEIVAAGHRIVHGGTFYAAPVLVDDEVIDNLTSLIPLARTHQPYGLAGIASIARALPGLPQIACFDTAFHRTIPAIRQGLPLPRSITEAGVRKYGFHGLSYDWISRRLPEVLGDRCRGRVIVAHLGNGASLCGMVNRQSRATTMGFTPLDGLIMGERPGSLDPGVILYLFEELGLDVADVRHMLFRQSGLVGVSGVSNDMRTLLASNDPRAAEAVDLYVNRIVREVAGIAAEIGGLDAVVFTAGIGENAVPIRARVLQGLEWLGVDMDEDANDASDATISRADAALSVHVIPTNEEAVIAGAVRQLIG